MKAELREQRTTSTYSRPTSTKPATVVNTSASKTSTQTSSTSPIKSSATSRVTTSLNKTSIHSTATTPKQDSVVISDAARKALQSTSQPTLVKSKSSTTLKTQSSKTIEAPKYDSVEISDSAKKAFNTQSSTTAITNDIKLSNSDKKLPKDIQKEIKHLQEMYKQTEDKEVKKELSDLANQFRTIGKNKDSYTVLRVNTFIPFDKVGLTPDELYGGDGRGFDANSVAVRTSQIILVDTSKNKVYSANYIGKTHQYDGDGNLTGEELLKLKNANMDVDYSVKDGKVNIVATVSAANPMENLAPSIDYRMEFNVTKNKTTLVQGKESYDRDTGVDIKGSQGSVIDGFPGYEVYGNIDGTGYQSLYKYKPDSPLEFYKLVDGPGDVEVPGATIKKK